MARIPGTTGDDTLTGLAGRDLLVGLAGNDTLDGLAGADQMEGGLGADLYIVDDVDDVIVETGTGIDSVESSVDYTLSASVENLTLTGGVALVGTGNTGNNTITGNALANTLIGGKGNDRMIGGLGDDLYIVNATGDVADETGGGGIDMVEASASFTLSTGVEILTLTGKTGLSGTGSIDDNTITGNDGINTLKGMGGADTLEGGLGLDKLFGGTGNDLYIVDDKDTITELAGEGNDSVLSTISYTLSANVETLTLVGPDAITGIGGIGDNTLIGNVGNNTLDGGVGNDSLIGGDGDDTYLVDSAGDTITELAGEGIDSVRSSVTFTLGAEVENLALNGTTAINATGNGLANTLAGNTAANVLTGGAGDDTYVVGAGDTVVELGGGGTDTIMSSISWTLDANTENVILTGTAAINATGTAGNNTLGGNTGLNTLDGGLGNDTYIIDAKDKIVDAGGTDTVRAGFTYTLIAGMENLELSGTGNFNATGNTDDNTITGNSGNNTLDGAAGTDTLQGAAGNDVYIVNDGSDTIVENAGEGTDTVLSTITHTLAAEVENLTLLGAAAINATGNAGNNTLTGNSAANVLTGGLGNDTYVIDALDTIAVDTGGSDTVAFSGTFDISGRADLENITLLGTGAFNATGNGNDNTLTGNSGINTLNGGAGNDTYVIGKTDVIADTSGTDTVVANFTYTLGVDMENLILTAGMGIINGSGNAGVNTLTGNSGANTLDGKVGIDAYIGGLGNDVYVVDDSSETITELAGEGTDAVRASASYTLGAELENLVLTGTGTIDGTGNALKNTLTGNAGNNTLDGGLDADILQGGAGNDTYIVDHIKDVVSDQSGIDTVVTSVEYAIGLGIENIVLSGAANLKALGNNSSNIITGNTGDNTLSGFGGNDTLIGGDGADTLDGGGGTDSMIGGLGDDVYYINFQADTVTELAGQGIDTVFTTGQYTLGDSIENAVATGISYIVNITGNALGNTLTGHGGGNILRGLDGNDFLMGGFGNDNLHGGNDDDILWGQSGIDSLYGDAGADTFYFGGLDTFKTRDVVVDFSTVDGDAIDISNLLTFYTPSVDNLSDFVKLVQQGAQTIVKVDVTGSGIAANYGDIALLVGVTVLPDVDTMVLNGNLIVT